MNVTCNVDIDDIIDEIPYCSDREYSKLIKVIRSDSRFKMEKTFGIGSPEEQFFFESLSKLSENYHVLSIDQREAINNLAKNI